MSCAFDYGKEHFQGVKRNPCQGVKVTVKKGKRERWLTDTEISAVFAALPSLKDPRAADVYTLILASLCRPGEASNILPVSGLIAEVIDRRLALVGGEGPLFWSTEGEDYPAALKQANPQLRELAGLKDIRPHDFRRTGRTHISGLGVRDEVAEALLNHAKEQVNGTYNLYSYWQERKEALKLWHEKLERLQAQALAVAA